MNVIGFLRSSIPMLVCIVGMYLFTVRRENCQMKFNICIVVVFAIEFVIYYFMFAEEMGTVGVPISKILTLLMISFLTFLGGCMCMEAGQESASILWLQIWFWALLKEYTGRPGKLLPGGRWNNPSYIIKGTRWLNGILSLCICLTVFFSYHF